MRERDPKENEKSFSLIRKFKNFVNFSIINHFFAPLSKKKSIDLSFDCIETENQWGCNQENWQNFNHSHVFLFFSRTITTKLPRLSLRIGRWLSGRISQLTHFSSNSKGHCQSVLTWSTFPQFVLRTRYAPKETYATTWTDLRNGHFKI